MSGSLARALLLLAAAACTPAFREQATSASASTSTTTGASTTTDTTSSTSSTATTDLPTTGPGTTSPPSNFIVTPDGGGGTKQCDQWREDCPEGHKCMPASLDGDGSWETLICSPIVPDPDGVGEPCTVKDSPVSGEDSCDKHMMCFFVDPDTGIGTCLAMCIGSEDGPSCADPDTFCPAYSDGVLTLCFPQCDPLAQDCPGDDLCIPHPGDPERFLCVLDLSGDAGQVFDPCEYANVCDPGLHCADPQLAHECDPEAGGCCLPFCDLFLNDAPNTCPGQDQQCLPWYEPGQAPPGHEQVGHCALP